MLTFLRIIKDFFFIVDMVRYVLYKQRNQFVVVNAREIGASSGVGADLILPGISSAPGKQTMARKQARNDRYRYVTLAPVHASAR